MRLSKIILIIMVIVLLTAGCASNKTEVVSPTSSETPAVTISPSPTSTLEVTELPETPEVTEPPETPKVTEPPEATKTPVNIAEDVKQLFNKYSWTIDHEVVKIAVILPDKLIFNVGEFPTAIYWAYNNSLSAHIGLDMSEYLGQEVTAEVYVLNEPIPDRNTHEPRGIIIRSEGEIIGAFIDAGRHYSFACALDRESLEDITSDSWDAWVDGFINYDDPLVKELAVLSHEEVIEAYYNAIDSGDLKRAMALETIRKQSLRLSMNMDNSKQIYNEATVVDFNLNSVKVISIEKIKYDTLKNAWMYKVMLDMDFVTNVTSYDGVAPRYLFLKQETERSGWKISEIGTGP